MERLSLEEAGPVGAFSPFGSAYLYSFIFGLDSRNHNNVFFLAGADVGSRTLGLMNAECSTSTLYFRLHFCFFETGAHYVALLDLKLEFCQTLTP